MELNISRLYSLTQRHLLRDGKKYLIAILAGTLIAVLITLLSSVGNGVIDTNIFSPIILLLFLVGGAIITTSIFSELNKPDTGYQLMILPVSNLEKFTSAWLISLPIFALAGIFGIYLGIGLINLSTVFGLTLSGSFFQPDQVLELVQAYFVIHPIAILGAATFKKNALIKTVIGMNVFSFIIAIVSVSLFWLSEKIGLISSTHTSGNNVSFNISPVGNPDGMLTYIAFYAVMLFLWVVAYFKLKERTL